MAIAKSDLVEILKKRRTTFNFSNKKVADEDLVRILEAGRLSPSSHNSQPWSFILIKDKTTIDTLMKNYSYGAFYTEPPIIIAMVLEKIYSTQPGLLTKKLSQITESHKYLCLGFAASNIINEAESLGINTCILSPIVKEANKVLGVPAGREAVLLIGLGYREPGTFVGGKDRKAFKDIVMYEMYGVFKK